MIRELRIQNFKAWKDTGSFRLAPLTVLFGANSAGKSSLGHLLLALKQTVISSDRKRAMVLGDSRTLIDLGTFEDCLHNHDPKNEMSFFLRWDLPEELKIINTKKVGTVKANEVSLKTVLKEGKNGQPEIVRIEYRLFFGTQQVLDVDFFRTPKNEFELDSETYHFQKSVGRKWPLEEPEKFYRASDLSLARFENADFMVDLALSVEKLLGNLYYLGPLREAAKRTYLWSGNAPEDVGLKGEDAIAALLAAQADGRQLNRKRKATRKPFAEFIADWLKELGVIQSFRVNSVAEGRKE